LVHSDILEFDEAAEYDQVVANFFLNVFPEDFMITVMKHLTTLVKPDGYFVVGDFHFPSGFIFFDPIYENGEVIGYVPNISRASESFPLGIFYTLMAKVFEQFKAEGIPYIFLGLFPLALSYPLSLQNLKYYVKC
jgi:NADPH-dependent 2,4-dienoyl-CoA reductase/sulfur reductase-like enzyme